jgi:hypothetical protein
MYATMQNISDTLPLWILLALVLIPLVILLFQWLWNITMPQVFNLNTVTFWQAFRLLLISGFLFKATGGE